MHRDHFAEHIGSELRHRRLKLAQSRTDSCKSSRICHSTPHDLNETRIVGSPAEESDDVGAIGERRRLDKSLHLGPPRTLFRTLAVGPRCGLGFESGDHDEPSIISDALGGAEVTLRARPQFGIPPVGLRVGTLRDP